MSGPRVYALPLGRAVAEGFAAGYWARHGADDPLRRARSRIFANNPRTRRLVEEALADMGPGSTLLPRIETVADLGKDPLAPAGLPPEIRPLRRHLRLIRLVERYLEADPARAVPRAAAPALAEALEGLLDECDEIGLPPEALDGATEGAHAAHWARTLAFVDLVRRAWPAIRAEEEDGAPDPKARQRAAVEALLAAWEETPPEAPVIAAGSTGSVPSTARLLAGVARLSEGAVVLPGFDPELPRDVWARIVAGDAPEHPMAPFAGLLGSLGMAPADVEPWEPASAAHPRARLLRLALRPAPVTDAWQAEAPALRARLAGAAEGLTLVEADGSRAEAAAIALAVRRGLETPGCRIAVVTPDGALARRVTAELGRFGIVPDDSLGRPLAQSPPGVFLRLVARIAAEGGEPVTVAGLLQHPLMRAGLARGRHMALARTYEVDALRGQVAAAPPGRLPRWPKAGEAEADWLAGIEAALGPLAAAVGAGAPLAEVASAQVAAAEALSTGPDGPPEVWEQAAGKAARAVMEGLAANADAHGDGPAPSWPALLSDLLGREEVRPEPTAPHPRVVILGPREARAQEADLVILGGLVEGVWPATPAPDPWLSRPMRAAVGLGSPEARIGLSAHDFLHAASRPQVVVTRARKLEGSPAVASRWLIRLATLMDGVDGGEALKAARARGEALLALLPAIHGGDGQLRRECRPAPRPAVEARPRRLSVTEVETLVRDAYAVYARRVLRLEPLEPLGRGPDARDRGTVFHEILERFVEATRNGLPDLEAGRERLMEIADGVLAERVPAADLRAIWRARLARVSRWFVETEIERRRTARPALLEVKGELEIEAPAGPFLLRAKADRIDLTDDGRAAIYDYKTGSPPGDSQIDLGFSQQLHLQAAILVAGGFGEIGPREPAHGAYLGLTGSGEGGKERRRDTLAEEVAEHMEKFRRLIAAYDHGAAYVSRGRVQLRTEDRDYDHLARRGEWEDDP